MVKLVNRMRMLNLPLSDLRTQPLKLKPLLMLLVFKLNKPKLLLCVMVLKLLVEAQ